MDAEMFAVKKSEVLAECEVSRQVFQEVEQRLEDFLGPFVGLLARREQAEHALTFVRGLLSDLDHRNVESIAYRSGQGRVSLQHFMGGRSGMMGSWRGRSGRSWASRTGST